MALNPQQLALQNKAALEKTGAFVVQPDGSVKMSADRGGGFAPPWVWAPAIPQYSYQQAGAQYSLPASDPKSAWHDMYAGGDSPFTNHSTWDSKTGTYDAGIDWGTTLGTAAVGGLFAAPAIAGALGGSAATGAASGASAGAGAGSGVAGGAGVAGTTAAGAGWFSPANIIPSAISGIASIFGANQQANASSEAAQLQYKATEEALADARAQREYSQQQYANYLGRLQPYLGLGTSAGSTLQNLLQRSPYTKLANNGPLPQYSTAPPSAPMQPQPGTQAQMPTTVGGGFAGGMAPVTLKAPDGSTKQVDPSMVNHYLSLGAVQV